MSQFYNFSLSFKIVRFICYDNRIIGVNRNGIAPGAAPYRQRSIYRLIGTQPVPLRKEICRPERRLLERSDMRTPSGQIFIGDSRPRQPYRFNRTTISISAHQNPRLDRTPASVTRESALTTVNLLDRKMSVLIFKRTRKNAGTDTFKFSYSTDKFQSVLNKVSRGRIKNSG